MMKQPLTVEEVSNWMTAVKYDGNDFIHIVSYDGKLKVRVFESTHPDCLTAQEIDVLIENGENNDPA